MEKRLSWMWGIVFAIAFAIPAATRAQEGTLGFLQSETGSIIEFPYYLRVSAAYLASYDSDNTGEDGDLWQFARVQFAASFSKRVELGISFTPYMRFDGDAGSTSSGHGDVRLSAKIQVFKGERWSLATRAMVKLPNAPAARDFGTNLTDTELLVIASFGNRNRLHLFSGVEIRDDNSLAAMQNDLWVYGVAGEFRVSERWSWGLELRGARDTYLHNDELVVGAGISYRWDRWELDFGLTHTSTLLDHDGLGGRVGIAYHWGTP